MEALAGKRQDTVIRVIDIKNWGSPVARQHRINRIPQLWTYEGGKLVSTDPQAAFDRLSR